jgi:hypothetical protein
LFSKRELRAIGKQKPRQGMSLEALVCVMGVPDRVTRTISRPPERVERYYYVREGELDLIVTVSHEEDQSTVVNVLYVADAEIRG